MTVVAADAEAAIERARLCVSNELHKGGHVRHARIACVEFVTAIDFL